MKFKDFEKYLKQLEQEKGNIKKAQTISELILDSKTDAPSVILLLNGQAFPARDKSVLGISDNYIVKAISLSSGVNEKEVKNVWRELGDLGSVCEKLLIQKKQERLVFEELTILKVLQEIRSLSSIEGKDSVKIKVKKISKLLINSTPSQAKYLTRIILGNLRLGVSKGIIRDGLSLAFNVEKKIIQNAIDYTNDLEDITKKLIEKNVAELEKSELKLFRPISSMLFPVAKTIQDGFEKIGRPCLIDFKYDGIRAQIHKNEEEVIIFTRSLDEVTTQFPDIVELVKNNIKSKTIIIDSEIVAIGPNGEYLPFQELSKRIRRKYDIQKVLTKISAKLLIFDVLFNEGESLADQSYEKRRAVLKEIIIPTDKIRASESIITSDVKAATEFNQKSLSLGEEGIMMKNLQSPYQPGRRVGAGVKVKPILEPLDVIITGGVWGEGKRSNWISSFIISIRGEDGKLLEIGKIATGLTEKQFSEYTKKLTPLITSTNGRKVSIRPEMVIEVGYEEIQKSKNYSSGFALRFPRIIRERIDKTHFEADDLKRVKKIYLIQRK